MHTSRRALLQGMTAAAVLPTAACGKIALPNVDLQQFMPKVTFKKLKIKNISFQDVATEFIFNVANPNPIKVSLGSFAYSLDLAGTRFVEGDQADGLQLEARGDSQLVLPVATTFANLANLVGSLKGKDAIPFGFAGNLGFNTPLGEVKIPFQESGDFPVLRPPKIQLQKLKLDNINLLQQKANLTLALGVSHEGGSKMDFSNFGYGVTLAGKNVLDGTLASLGEVAKGQTKTVELPIGLNLLNLGTTIVSALTKKEKLQVGLGADLTVGTPFGALPLHIDETGKLQIV